jgi:ABC-type multidrug transport system fused ATPase/permease subunit
MARIVIVRANEYINRYRGISLHLDGKKIGYIDNADDIDFEIPEGNHQLVAKIDWCGSRTIDFNISENDTQVFDLSGFKHSRILMPMSVTLVILHLIMQYFFEVQLSIFFILPLFLLLIYYISIGRDQYLTLEQREHSDELSTQHIK